MSKKLLPLLLITALFLACNNSNSSKEKEKNANQVETKPEKSPEQRFAESVESIHKKENFLKEDIVSYQITYQFGSLTDELKIKAATDLSIIEVDSKNFGKSYYNGKNILIDASANMGDKEAKRNFQLVYFYHAFFHLNENAYQISPVEKKNFKNSDFQQIQVTNTSFHIAFFPSEITFLIEDRTNMMKGLALETSLLGNGRNTQDITLNYDRFITVNHIPVALNWKFYPENKMEENDMLGKAQITRIKYYSAEDLQLEIPENAKVIKTSPIL